LKLKNSKINRFFYLNKRRNIMGQPTPTPVTTLAGTTLTNMQDFTTGVLGAAENAFKLVTNAISTGGALSMAEMI
jgi:hypothetical protein